MRIAFFAGKCGPFLPKVFLALCTAGLLAGTAHAIPEGPAANTPEWAQREEANYARTSDAPNEQKGTAFQQRLQTQNQANQLSYVMRAAGDSSWLDPRSGNTEFTPLCTSWVEQCAGDPFRYPGVDPFYNTVGEVTPVVFYDAQCARLSGRLWAPKGSKAGDNLPGVVIETGSIQAPEPLYWWMAQALVRQGYVVMTFDVRGQGRSDQQSPTGGQGSNADSTVFFAGLVNVIDFFHSGLVAPYPHNATCAGTYPTPVVSANPYFDRLDRNRLGIVGHSLGASGVSAVQGYNPWPGLQDSSNPVDVVVAWDSLAGGTNVPRVPAMGQTSEYGIGGTAKTAPPAVEGHKAAYIKWRDASVPVYQLTIQGSTHFEWSLIPTFPASSWCPEVDANGCKGGWGRPMAEYYSVAWIDRWLKLRGEPGYADADTRLLNDPLYCQRLSFYSRGARNYRDRGGKLHNSEDLRADCLAGKVDTVAALEPFSFIERRKVPPATLVTSEAITVRGSGSELLHISNGEYSINGAPFTAADGPLAAGDKLLVRHRSASTTNTDTLTSLILDSFTVNFRSVTTTQDRVPDAFTFGLLSGQAPGAMITSAPNTLTGFDTATAITAGPGIQYQVNDGAFTNSSGTLLPGQSLTVRHISNSAHLGYTKNYLKVGGVTGYFTTRTQ